MSGQFRASVLWRALKSPSPQPSEAQPLVFSHGTVLPAFFLWMGCGRGWSVPTRGCTVRVKSTHPSEDARAGLERLHGAMEWSVPTAHSHLPFPLVSKEGSWHRPLALGSVPLQQAPRMALKVASQ